MKVLLPVVPLMLAVVGCHLFSRDAVKPPPAASGPAPVRPGVIAISPANTTIAFTGSTALASQSGHFAAFDGTLELPTDDPKDLRIRVAVDMDSTTTKIGLLTRHLKAEDFFDVARYPKAEFVLDGVAPPLDKSANYPVSGHLTLHGVRKAISFPARIAVTPDEVTFDATIPLLQTEFGMTEAAKKTKDEVPVTVSIRGRRR